MKNKTIAEILNECQIGDQLTNGILNWTVQDRYTEEEQLVVIAIPMQENSFEIWSTGVEEHSFMPNLKKII
jgi:hypothetical protein